MLNLFFKKIIYGIINIRTLPKLGSGALALPFC
jgi:hypothetical protein